MGHACTHANFPRSPKPDREHPVTAAVAILAILIAMLLIAWARVEVHGTDDLAGFIDEAGPLENSMGHSTIWNKGSAENEAASSRWATGFSH